MCYNCTRLTLHLGWKLRAVCHQAVRRELLCGGQDLTFVERKLVLQVKEKWRVLNIRNLSGRIKRQKNHISYDFQMEYKSASGTEAAQLVQ
jgi:hypothetical protein